jgi:hypothetical protein
MGQKEVLNVLFMMRPFSIFHNPLFLNITPVWLPKQS